MLSKWSFAQKFGDYLLIGGTEPLKEGLLILAGIVRAIGGLPGSSQPVDKCQSNKSMAAAARNPSFNAIIISMPREAR